MKRNLVPQKRVDNGVTKWRVDLGIDEATGKRNRPTFPTEEAALAFIRSLNDDPVLTGEIFARKNEIAFQLDRLQQFGATLSDAVDFFITHSAKNHKITFNGAAEKHIANMRQESLNAVYVENTERLLKKFGQFVNNAVVDVITSDQVRNYVYTENEGLSPVTQSGMLRDLSVFFRFCRNQGFCSFNPVEKIKRPKAIKEAPSVLEADDMKGILDKCYRKEWYDRLAVHLLVAFCGFRVEEASKMNWADIDLETKRATLSGGRAKMKRHRINDIPDNAIAWFRKIEDKRRTGPIIGPTWKVLMRASVSDCDNYKKNCIRHSYCSNALVWYGQEKLNWVIAQMGHMPGEADTIYDHYRNIRTKEQANAWFSILPQ